MTYSIQTKDGIVINNIPDSIDKNDDYLKRLVASERAALAQRATYKAQADENALMTQGEKDQANANEATKDMNWGQKALANIGGGMYEAGKGVGQLWTDITGSKQDSANARKEADTLSQDLHGLAGTTTGGSALQFAGAVLPTLAIPAGAGVNALRGASALARGLPRAVAAAPKFASLAGAGDMALMGGAQGMVAPVGEGGSRTANTAIGATLGAALPAAGGAIGGAWNKFTPMGRAASAPMKAAEELAASLSEATGLPKEVALKQTLAKLQQQQLASSTTALQPHLQAPASGIPLTTAAELADPHLARIEVGSRARNGANYYDFDQNQARKVFEEFSNATSDAGKIGERRTTRGQNWDTNWGDAQRHEDLGKLSSGLATFKSNLIQATQSAESSNPAVLSLINTILKDIDRLGDNFTLGHLQQIRANLSGRAKFNPTNAYEGAPRDSFATKSILTQVDNILNDATGGAWAKVPKGYAEDSRLVDQAKAASRTQGKYVDQETGRVLGVAADASGDVPKITEAGLGGAINAARQSGKPMLSPEAQTHLNAILSKLRAQNITQGVKRSATAGGGSDTISNRYAAQAAGHMADSLTGGVGGAVLGAANKAAQGKSQQLVDAALAQALQNPREMQMLLERKLAEGTLNASEELILNTLRGMAGQVTQAVTP